MPSPFHAVAIFDLNALSSLRPRCRYRADPDRIGVPTAKAGKDLPLQNSVRHFDTSSGVHLTHDWCRACEITNLHDISLSFVSQVGKRSDLFEEGSGNVCLRIWA